MNKKQFSEVFKDSLFLLQDYYICKLTSCQTMIMFENCGARSKILNHYTSHFQVVIY